MINNAIPNNLNTYYGNVAKNVLNNLPNKKAMYNHDTLTKSIFLIPTNCEEEELLIDNSSVKVLVIKNKII